MQGAMEKGAKWQGVIFIHWQGIHRQIQEDSPSHHYTSPISQTQLSHGH